MQPGGSVLPGKTADERDASFLSSLSKLQPELFGPAPKTIGDAQKIATKVLALDPWKLPVGIEFNRISEDGFHGTAHASLANWIPDTSVKRNPAFESAELAYVQSPTNENWRALDRAVVQASPDPQGADYLSLLKYRSLLYATHRVRVERGMSPGPMPSDIPDGNPLWLMGEFARTHDRQGFTQIGLPSSVVAAKSVGPAFSDQLATMRLPWWWLGWMTDPSLQNSGLLWETRRGDYFSMALISEGPYPAHALLMLTRKLMEQTRPGFTRPFDYQYSFLLIGQPLLSIEPKDPAARKLFRAFAHTAFCTNLLLLQNDLKTRKLTVVPESQNLQMEETRKYLKAIKMPEDKLIDQTKALMKATKVFGRYPHPGI